MFDPTARGDVFVRARIYDWLTNVCTFGAMSRAYGRAAALLAADRPRRVLDVGTGAGAMALALKRCMPDTEVHGVDPSERMLDVARMNGVRAGEVVHFHSGWAQELPFVDGEFDAVTFAWVLSHIPEPQRAVALVEARRVLRPGARVLIVEVVPPPVLASVVPLRGVDLDGCRRLLHMAGLENMQAGRMTRALFAYALGRRPQRPAVDWYPAVGDGQG